MSHKLLWDVITTALIFGGPLPATIPHNFPTCPEAMESLKRVCQRFELADTTEWNSWTYYNSLYWANHNQLKVSQYPGLDWCTNIPSKEIIDWNLQLINDTQDAINHDRIGADWDQQTRRQANIELMNRHQLWDTIRQAKCHSWWSFRRSHLNDLRKLVGDSVFVSGHWPNPVPLWIIPDAPRRDR